MVMRMYYRMQTVCFPIVTAICLLQMFYGNYVWIANKTKLNQIADDESSVSDASDLLIFPEDMRSLVKNVHHFKSYDNDSVPDADPADANDWKLAQKEPFFSRKRHVMEMCRRKIKITSKILSERINFSDRIKLIMCETPKAASTTWQVLFLQLSGYKKKITKSSVTDWAFFKFPNKNFARKSGITKENALKRAQRFTSFLISRHPLTRLVSAYYDKFTNLSKYSLYKQQHGRRIAYLQALKKFHQLQFQRMRKRNQVPIVALSSYIQSSAYKLLSFEKKKELARYLFAMRTGEITFPQFIDSIVDQYKSNKARQLNPHWQIQVEICQPCIINYTFYVKFENLTAESKLLLKYFQRNRSPNLPQLHFPEKSSYFNITDEVIRNAWKLIPEEKVAIIRRIFKDDFAFYDYDPYQYKGHK